MASSSDPFVVLNEYDVYLSDYAHFAQILAATRGVERAWLFGSRARGTHRYNSDVDIAIDVPRELAFRARADLLRELDELPLGQRFDVVALPMLDNERLRTHILNEGILLAEAGQAVYPKPAKLSSSAATRA